MAKVSKRVVVFRPSTKGRSKETEIVMEDFKREKRIRKGRLLPSPTMTLEERLVISKPRRKPATKRKTTAKKSIISPICRKAGRTLKATGSPAAGRTLGSKKCKTKSTSTKTTATRKRATTTRKSTSSTGIFDSVVKSVKKAFSPSKSKKVVSKSSPTKRRSTRTTSCAKKVAAIRKILK
jgi:hypothetical protein